MNVLRVLLVASDRRLVRAIRAAAQELDPTSVSVVESVVEARRFLQSAVIDLIVIDLTIHRREGTEFVLRTLRATPAVAVLVATDRHLQDYDREAIRAGVSGFLVKPLRRAQVQFQLAQVREQRRLREEHVRLTGAAAHADAADGIVGASSEMRQVLHLARRAAASAVPVALYGESGTGKELVAHSIHRASERRSRPFVAVNPSAIPESLLESELFGHVRGAFTGAAGHRVGYFEAAHRGTLFLDEIGDLPLAVQGRLLRVLQQKSIQRIGSSETVPVDFRLVTATHNDLVEAVREGRFREDLFYRIHVFPIYLPPLRARRTDIPLLAEHFLRSYSKELDRPLGGFAPGVLELLMSHTWPGNVRELENVVHRLVAMKAEGSMVEMADLAGLVEGVRAAGVPASRPDEAFAGEVRALDDVMDDYIGWAYRKLGRNKSLAAQVLGVHRTTLHRMLRRAAEGRAGP